MPMNQAFLAEFDQEFANTRKTLERVPDDKWDYKPHPKSGTLGWLANHIAMMPGWAASMFQTDNFDVAPGGKQVEMPNGKNRKEILAIFDEGAKQARAGLASSTDEQLMKPWALAAKRPAHLLHAARRRPPRHDHEPPHPPSRPANRLLSPQRCPSPRPLRPISRRRPTTSRRQVA